MSFVNHYRAAPRPNPPAWTLRSGLAAVSRAGLGASVSVVLAGGFVALLALQAPHSRQYLRLWQDGLKGMLGEPAARCVAFRMSQRVSDRELEATLELTEGDLSADPRLSGLLAASIERCRKQHLLLVQ